MRLMAVIFLVWVAQAQGAAGAATTTTPEAETTTEFIDTTTSPIPTTTGTDDMTSTVVATVPTTPVPACTPIDTPATLSIDGESPCTATRFNNQTIQFKSPNFPNDYPNSVECRAETSSDGPRTLEITPKIFAVHESDKLIIKGPFGYKRKIQIADLNTTISLPSAYAKFEFTSSDKKNMKGFKVNIRSKTNSCQRICSLQANATGYIMNGVYGADTYCEWWMEAPTGCFIRMKFEMLDVGLVSSNGSSCIGDYVGVDRNGDPGYGSSNTKAFCGSMLPNVTRSKENKLNVLFNGRDGGYNGFKIKYTVVC